MLTASVVASTVFFTASSLSRTNCCKESDVDTIVLELLLLLVTLEDVLVIIVFDSVSVPFSPMIIVLVFGVVVILLSNTLSFNSKSLFVVSECSPTEDRFFVGEILVLKVVVPPSPITIVLRIVVPPVTFLFWEAPDRRASSRMRALASFNCLSKIFFRCSNCARFKARLLFSLVASIIAEEGLEEV